MYDALYARQSIEKKDSISVESQLEYCRYETHGEACIEYTDKGFSGKDTIRPGFEKMMNDIRTGKIKRVIVYKLDRIKVGTLLCLQPVGKPWKQLYRGKRRSDEVHRRKSIRTGRRAESLAGRNRYGKCHRHRGQIEADNQSCENMGNALFRGQTGGS